MRISYGPCRAFYPGLGRLPQPCFLQAVGPEGLCRVHQDQTSGTGVTAMGEESARRAAGLDGGAGVSSEQLEALEAIRRLYGTPPRPASIQQVIRTERGTGRRYVDPMVLAGLARLGYSPEDAERQILAISDRTDNHKGIEQ